MAQIATDVWVLVPARATPEMIAAAEGVEDLYKRGTPETWARVYSEMIAVVSKLPRDLQAE